MDKIVKHASSTDNVVVPITRYDQNISSGIIYAMKEHQVTDLIIGLHRNKQEGDTIFGPVADKILRKTFETIYVYHPIQPLNTLKRILAAIPPKAEMEPGFSHWFSRLYLLSKSTGLPLKFHGNADTLARINHLNESQPAPLSIQTEVFNDWDEFLFFSGQLKKDDLFIVITSRKGHLSFRPEMEKIPYLLTKYFMNQSFIVLYPGQLDAVLNVEIEKTLEKVPFVGRIIKGS